MSAEKKECLTKKITGMEKKDFAKYIFASLVSGSTEFLSFYAIYSYAQVNYILTAVISFLLSTLVGYVMKRKFAFRNTYRPRRKQFATFAAATLGGAVINTGIVVLLVEFLSLSPTVSKLIGILIVFVYNYILSKDFIFHKMK